MTTNKKMDKNNKEIKTGDIVKIEGGFFKADNGLFKVITSPGDKNWSGSDYWIKRLNKSGTFSKSKGSGQFWPLMVTVSSREKSLEAREHNEKNATITVLSEDLQQVKKIREVQEIAKSKLIDEGVEKVREENGYYRGYKLHDILEDLKDYGLSYEESEKTIMELYDKQQAAPEEVAEETQETQEETAPEEPTTAEPVKTNTDVAILFNQEKNGIEVKFDGKPDTEILENLKANGFRWSKYQKIWYAKDTAERRAFLKVFDAVETESEPKDFDYPEIDIDDIESYTIDPELSRRENESNWIFRTEKRDHTEELQSTLQHYQNQAAEIISSTSDKEIIYKVKRDLQRFKKAYTTNYTAILQNKASNPSWAVTGPAGRNRSKDQKANDRYIKLITESAELREQFENSLDRYTNKIHANKRKENYINIENTVEELDFKVENKDITYLRVTQNLRTYNHKNYMIAKLWGAYKIFKDGEEIKNMRTTDTLNTTKKALQLIINTKNQEKQAI